MDRQWYQDAAASDGAVITEPYIDALTGEMVITIAKAFRRDGSVFCVVAADLFLPPSWIPRRRGLREMTEKFKV